MKDDPRIAELLAPYPVVVIHPVFWGDMDSYGHVNNVVYFRYLENARVEYFHRMRWKQEIEAETGIGPIVSEMWARYRRPLHYPDTIAVTARLKDMGEDRFTLEHIVVSQNLRDVATLGESKVVTFNYRENKKVPVPQVIKDRMAEMEGRGSL